MPQQPSPEPSHSGFDLAELRHLTQDDEQLTRHLLEQLSISVSEDLAALRASLCLYLSARHVEEVQEESDVDDESLEAAVAGDDPVGVYEAERYLPPSSRPVSG